MRGRRKIFFSLLLLLLATVYYLVEPERWLELDRSECSGQAGCFTGVVTRVIDGDTLEVGGRRIRLVLVDAPERDTPAGPASTDYLRELCPPGSPARVDQDDSQPTDSYGRLLAVVWCGGRRANEELIRAGHAEVYRRFCRESEFGDDPWALALGCR